MTARRNRNNLIEGSLTSGIVRLAGPMFVSAMLQNLQSVIDLFWVGKLGSDSVAALAMSGTVLMMLFPVIMGVATGTVALVARAIGAGDNELAADSAGQSLVLGMGFGALVGIAGFLTSGLLCRWLGAEPIVEALGEQYLQVSFVGSFTVFLLFIGNSAMQGAGNTVIPMITMVLANVLNLGLDPLLIFGIAGFPRLEVRGAALATVISQAVAAALVLGVLLSGDRGGVHVRRTRWRVRADLMQRLLRIGVPSAGQMLSRSVMALVLMRIVAEAGTIAVAAYGIGLRFHMLILMPAFTLGNAVATMVGQNLGAKRPDRAERAAWLGTGIDVGITVLGIVILLLAARPLIAVFDGNPDVVAEGVRYLRTVSPFYVFAAFAIVLGRGLMGAGDTVGPLICTLIGLWGVQVPLALWLSRVVEPSTQGVWWAIGAAIVVHGSLVTAWFMTGRWKRKQV